jgi:pyridoxamine 5'-phosphate oxidase-like protein
MPGYGTLPAGEGSGLLPWSWAADRLSRSHDYWLATVGPAGRPHVMPVWGVWRDGALWFSSAKASRKARNLGTNPWATATTDNAYEPVVVQGRVELVADHAAIALFAGWVDTKYETNYGVEFFADGANGCFRLQVAWAFALTEDDFTGSPTRWRFPTG